MADTYHEICTMRMSMSIESSRTWGQILLKQPFCVQPDQLVVSKLKARCSQFDDQAHVPVSSSRHSTRADDHGTCCPKCFWSCNRQLCRMQPTNRPISFPSFSDNPLKSISPRTHKGPGYEASRLIARWWGVFHCTRAISVSLGLLNFYTSLYVQERTSWHEWQGWL